MIVRQIGTVRSEIREAKAMPRLGAPATVEVFPEYGAGLLRLEKHSHLWVFAWLDQAQREVLQVTPRGVSDPGPEGLHGVFAVRSPARPNPIGATATKIVRTNGLSIEVDPLDFLDGTPVVDLKPYFVSRDLIFSATNAQIGRPGSREAMRDSFVMQALNFHGELCRDLALAVRVLEHFRSEVLQMVEPERFTATVPLGRPCLIDAVMGMTRVSPGRGTLRFAEEDKIRLECEGAACEYVPATSMEGGEVLGSEDHSIFEFRRR